jgi:Tol biopolymer transport system component
MTRDVLGMGFKRTILLLAAAVVVVSLVVSLMPGEPAAQTTSTNGKIAYLGYDTDAEKQDIYTMNPDGSGVSNLTSRYTDPNWSPLGNAHGDPEWSPDGTKISFTGTALSDIGSCCSRNVYVMDADGANLQRLSNTPSSTEGEDFQATWSPDGSWLAFTSTRSEVPIDPDNPINFSDDREIYRMDANGTNEQQLTVTTSRFTDEQPAVSPDGTKIAFASNRHWQTFGVDPDQLDIYVMDAADGANVQRLTIDAAPTSPTLSLESRSQNPTWSPDGSRIAYESTVSGNSEIWVMNSDGTNPVNVSQHEAWDSEPAWSPDGTGQDDIWAVDAPPATPSAPVALLYRSLGTDSAWAASEPRNLTPGSGVEASSPDWGTAPSGGGTVCTIKGSSGADTITGTPSADVICALGGNDTIKGLGGNDLLRGGGGVDVIEGDAGADKLYGHKGVDILEATDGVRGNDTMNGGRGLEVCRGDRGDTKRSCS